jgi:hypothetical protein
MLVLGPRTWRTRRSRRSSARIDHRYFHWQADKRARGGRDAGASRRRTSRDDPVGFGGYCRTVREPIRRRGDVLKGYHPVGAELPLGEQTKALGNLNGCRSWLRARRGGRGALRANPDTHQGNGRRRRDRQWIRGAASATQKQGRHHKGQHRSDNQTSLPPHRASSYDAAAPALSRTALQIDFFDYRSPARPKRNGGHRERGEALRCPPVHRPPCGGRPLGCWEEHCNRSAGGEFPGPHSIHSTRRLWGLFNPHRRLICEAALSEAKKEQTQTPPLFSTGLREGLGDEIAQKR